MVNVSFVRTIVGIIGNVISFGLFLSPVPTFVRIMKRKSVEAFKPDPYVVTVLNCMMWVFYGLPFVHPDSVLVVTINGIGLFIELIYVTIFLIYSHSWSKRRKILLILLGEVIFMVVIVLLKLRKENLSRAKTQALDDFSAYIPLICFHTTKKRSMFVGILCIVFNIGMYTSPLTVMKRVIRTRSVKYMPFYLSLANFCNGIVWSIYALLKFDPYILVPNGLGAISGMVQLILYMAYYKTTNWEEPENPSEVQIPNHHPQP